MQSPLPRSWQGGWFAYSAYLSLVEISLKLQRPLVWISWCGFLLLGCALFLITALDQFVIAVMTDPHLEVGCETLEVTALRFPNAARVHTRLAACLIEAGVSKSGGPQEIVARAIHHSSRAVQLAPRHYEPRVLLSVARELNGELPLAETELRAALALAPQRVPLHWRLANLLIRSGKLEQSLGEFRFATQGDPSLLPATLSLLWQFTKGNLAVIRPLVGADSRSQLVFAKLLAEHTQTAEVSKIISQLNPAQLPALPETKQLMTTLMAKQQYEQAVQFWQQVRGSYPAQTSLWNGDFENKSQTDFSEFDWQLTENRYAQISVTNEQARTGTYALGIAYRGIETTRLEQEIRQLIVVRPGARYRLEGYAKTQELSTSDGPRFVVTRLNDPARIAETATVTAGTHDWQLVTADFQVPAGATALLVTIKQTPQYSYAAPTTGTVWFDDVSLRER